MLLAAISLATGSETQAQPDYIMLDRCVSTMDEVRPNRTGQWQISFAEVSIVDQATGGGGWEGRHSYQFVAYAYTNGPNGYPEYGTGDDVCLGLAEEQPGTLTWSVVSNAPDCAGGTRALTDSPSGNYGSNWNITATIDQSFDFSNANDVRILYFHQHQLRWSNNSDQGFLEVNTGSGWTNVDPDDTPQTSHYQYYLGDNHLYRRGGADLSSLAGQSNVQIRFRFSSNSSSSDDGWFIDDVRVLVDGNTAFFDDFESGTGNWTLTGAWGQTLPSYGYDSSLGTISGTGLYEPVPITSPVSVGEGIGFNAVRARYVDGFEALNAYFKVYHNAPQYTQNPPTFGREDVCLNPVAVEESVPIHDRFLLANAPNPFNPTTRIVFQLATEHRTTLRIYDEAGRLVRSLLVDESLPAGQHEFSWDGRNEQGLALASGVYLYQLQVGDQTLSRSMVLIR